jgi:hypothetical protein
MRMKLRFGMQGRAALALLVPSWSWEIRESQAGARRSRTVKPVIWGGSCFIPGTKEREQRVSLEAYPSIFKLQSSVYVIGMILGHPIGNSGIVEIQIDGYLAPMLWGICSVDGQT